jgi:nitric oxide reductase large subunit
MNKRQTRVFALVSTGVAALVFTGLTIDSHRQFGKLTNAENITPAVEHGKDVWHKYNCINCNTLFGEGAYYAPDLTKIAQHRGRSYLQASRSASRAFSPNTTRVPGLRCATQASCSPINLRGTGCCCCCRTESRTTAMTTKAATASKTCARRCWKRGTGDCRRFA